MADEIQSPRLSLVDKGKLIGFHQAGLSVRHIGRILDRSYQTVNLWIRRYETEGVQGLVVRSRSGRPRLTTIEEDMAIIAASRLTRLSRF
jgi:transposase